MKKNVSKKSKETFVTCPEWQEKRDKGKLYKKGKKRVEILIFVSTTADTCVVAQSPAYWIMQIVLFRAYIMFRLTHFRILWP